MDPAQWHHCLCQLNLADLLTRGVSASELIQSMLWMKGPQDLFEEVHDAVDTHVLLPEGFAEITDLNRELAGRISLMTVEKTQPVLDIRKWSFFSEVLCVVGWILRFLHNVHVKHPDR